MKNQKTVLDIIAYLRNSPGDSLLDSIVKLCADSLADKLEEAVKRDERQRKALEAIMDRAVAGEYDGSVDCLEIIKIAEDALAFDSKGQGHGFPTARCGRGNEKGKTIKYIRSHIVEAKPATLGEWEAETGKKWNEADRPRTDEGYKCDYPDGYSGWCPKAEFEKVSSPVENMTFGQAIDACRYRGAKIQRANWNGEGQYVRYERINAFSGGGMTDHPEVVFDSYCFVFHFVSRKTGETGIQVGWLASQADMAASDWVIVE